MKTNITKMRFRALPVAVIMICLLFAVGVSAAVYSYIYEYNFKSVDTTIAIEYELEINKDEKIGWVGEVAGDGNSLHITYSQLELTNPDDSTWEEEMIIIEGAGGTRKFLTNAGFSMQFFSNGVLRSFWSAKLIDSDASAVYKDYSQDTIEIVDVAFEVENDRIINIYTSFYELDVEDKLNQPFSEMQKTFYIPYKRNIEGSINATVTFPPHYFLDMGEGNQVFMDINSIVQPIDQPAPNPAFVNDEKQEETFLVYGSYKTQELSRDENYKTMEMYVYDDNDKLSRKITFELPVEWLYGGSVFTNGEDYQYTLKVDMWDVKSATRESVFDEHIKRIEEKDILDDGIYSTENYEIFYCKLYFSEGDAASIRLYYLYANGERFCMSSYVFDEDKPEYDDIFMRIAESVKFQ